MLHCSYQHVLEPKNTYNSVFSRKKQISLFYFLRREKCESKFCKGKLSQNRHCKATYSVCTQTANNFKSGDTAAFRLPLQRWLFLFSHEPFRSLIMKRIGSRRESSEESLPTRLSGWMQTFKEYLQQYITTITVFRIPGCWNSRSSLPAVNKISGRRGLANSRFTLNCWLIRDSR